MLPALILSSDSHVFEPPDLWMSRIDRAFRERAPRMQRIDGADQIIIEKDQFLSGIGLISNAGARFEAPETISGSGRFEDVPRGGYDPEQHLADMRLDGVAGEVLYPSQGLFYFRVPDTPLMSAIFRAYNDWLAEFCQTDPARLKGIAMVNVDDVGEGVRELERAARMGLAGAMITEYPLEDRRYDQPEYEPFWAAAQSLGMPLSLHTATKRQGKIRGAGARTLRDASSRATKAFYPALSMCDMIFSGVFAATSSISMPTCSTRFSRRTSELQPACRTSWELRHSISFSWPTWHGWIQQTEPSSASIQRSTPDLSVRMSICSAPLKASRPWSAG